MYFLLVELIQPINCILISEDFPKISILLNERRSDSLKGVFLIGNDIKGNFYTNKPKDGKPGNWSFEINKNLFKGEMILFKDEIIWHPYQNKIKSHEVNKVLFYGFPYQLTKFTDEIELLKAASGFFKIGNECYGGRINNV